MANIRINQSGNTSKLRINKKEQDIREDTAPAEEPIEEQTEPDFLSELPVVEAPMKEEIATKSTEEPDISSMSPKELKKHNKKKNKKQKKDNNEPLDVDKAYKAYRKRKIAVFITLIAVSVLIVSFGLFNVFFKHQLTPQEAALYTNQINNQSIAQSWDSGIQSFLQKNLKGIMKKSFQSSSTAKDFEVSNISVEKNQPFGDTTFLTYFSCDVKAAGKSERIFCNIFIDTADNKYKALSGVNITTRKAYSADGEIAEKNRYLDFQEDSINQEATKEFKSTLENFLTLGYNSKQDVSNIYKGKSELAFVGTFKSIDKLSVYDKANELGYNACAVYTIELSSGVTYQNKCYMKIEKNDSGSYIIDMIL